MQFFTLINFSYLDDYVKYIHALRRLVLNTGTVYPLKSYPNGKRISKQTLFPFNNLPGVGVGL